MAGLWHPRLILAIPIMMNGLFALHGCSASSPPYYRRSLLKTAGPACTAQSPIVASGILIVGGSHEVYSVDLETLRSERLFRSEASRVRAAVPLDGELQNLLLVLSQYDEHSGHSECLARFDRRNGTCHVLFSGREVGAPVVSPDGGMFAWVATGDDGTIRLGLSPSDSFVNTRYFDADLVVNNTGPSWVRSARGGSKLLLTQAEGVVVVFDEQSGTFSKKVRGYGPVAVGSEDHFFYRGGEDFSDLLEFNGGAIRKVCKLGGEAGEGYSTLRISPDKKFASAIGGVTDQIALAFSKGNTRVVIIDLETGYFERVSGLLGEQQLSYGYGPWAWVASHDARP